MLHEDPQTRYEQLRVAWEHLSAEPAPTIEDLEALADQARACADAAEGMLADRVRLLELRILGTLLMRQAGVLRQLAGELRAAVQWVPPDDPGRN